MYRVHCTPSVTNQQNHSHPQHIIPLPFQRPSADYSHYHSDIFGNMLRRLAFALASIFSYADNYPFINSSFPLSPWGGGEGGELSLGRTHPFVLQLPLHSHFSQNFCLVMLPLQAGSDARNLDKASCIAHLICEHISRF